MTVALTDDPEWRAKKDEVLRRIGRNLVLYQQIEFLLKALLSSTRIEGYAHEIERKIADRAASVASKPLKPLINQFIEECWSFGGQDADVGEDVNAAHYRFNFVIETDPARAESDKAVLMALVDERNHLAHTFLKRWKPLSRESTDEALAHLDHQHAQATPVRDHLKSAFEAMVAGQKEAAERLISDIDSPQYKLAWLQQSRLVQLLAQIALTSAREDGWTLLSRAGDLLEQLAPEERERLKERYGHGALKPLLIASELFEVKDEPTGGGGSRVIYRVKPELVTERL